jgi:hypothetical protein
LQQFGAGTLYEKLLKITDERIKKRTVRHRSDGLEAEHFEFPAKTVSL